MHPTEPLLQAEVRLLALETLRPPLSSLRELLASSDPATAHAAAQALARREGEGEDDLRDLAAAVPGDVLSLAPGAQVTIADLVVRGLPLALPALSPELPPDLALRFRRAQLVSAPASLPLDQASEIDLRAAAGVPAERAIASGLLDRLQEHAHPAMHEIALSAIRAGLEAGLLELHGAQARVWSMLRRTSDAVAARGLRWLAEPWARGAFTPGLDEPFARGEEVALEVVRLAAARGELGWLREFVASDAPLGVRRAALTALGATGERDDVASILAAMEDAPAGLGPEAAEALRTLKRRGVSPDEEEAQRALALALRWEAVPLEAIAESVSSRADALLPAIGAQLARGAPAARAVSLLEAFGTRSAIARLVEMAADGASPVLSTLAIRALGRLEERDAEAVLLERLDAEPDACLFALGRVGGAATVRRLRDALAAAAPPTWLAEALGVLLRLDPAPEVLAAAEAHGALSSAMLDALPAYASRAQVDVLAAIAASPGHPFRASAIQALGRTGGPAAIDPLGALLVDADEATRDLAKGALRGLGCLLNTKPPPLACLEDARDPAGALLAEAALRRLKRRPASAAETALLLDAIAGCAHPHLVRVVRPLLRRESAEIRKRAAACLGAAGPACVPWLLPHLADAHLPVARQALIAIGAARVPGLGATLAAWLAHPNMNLKKAAAEALAGCGDAAAIQPLCAVLAGSDQPGLRALAEAALRAIAGPSLRAVLVEAMSCAKDLRQCELFSSILAGAFAPGELAALVALRPHLATTHLLRAAYAADTGVVAGKLAELDAELSRRGVSDRIPRAADVPPDSPLRDGLLRADAARCGRALRRKIREAPFASAPPADLAARVRAMGAQAPRFTELSVREQRILAGLLPQLDEATRADAVAILAGTPDAAVRERLLPYVALTGDPDPRHAPLLAAALAHRGTAAARGLSQARDRGAQARAAEVLRLAGEGELLHAPPQERPAGLRAWLDAGREDEVVAAIGAPGGPSLVEVAIAVAARSGAAAAMDLAARWVARAPAERAAAVLDLAFLGAAAEPALHALIRGDLPAGVRKLALSALAARRTADPELVRPLLDDSDAGVREQAALVLVRAGDRQDRARVLRAWLAGALPGGFTIALGVDDALVIEGAAGRASTEQDQIRLLEPVAALPPASAIPLLLSLWASPHARVAAAARDELRALAPARVLPFIEARLSAGDLAPLDVVGSPGAVPAMLAALARTSTDAAAWTRFGLRAAGTGLLYAAGLGERFAAWAAVDPSPAALAVLARLTDWYDGAAAEALVRALAPALEARAPRENKPRQDLAIPMASPAVRVTDGRRRGRVSESDRGAIVEAVLGALRKQPPALVARVLPAFVRPGDTSAVLLLASAEAASPGVVELLPAPLREAVLRSMTAALDSANDEDARKLLSYFAARAEHPSEREAALALIEKHVRPASRRVNLHAHRLLRALAPRDRYLRATRSLLGDPDPTTVRLAVRVLCFGGDLGAVDEIADKLSHPHAAVSRAVREGLLALGARAVPALERARTRARPDRRARIDAVLAEIRAREAVATGE